MDDSEEGAETRIKVKPRFFFVFFFNRLQFSLILFTLTQTYRQQATIFFLSVHTFLHSFYELSTAYSIVKTNITALFFFLLLVWSLCKYNFIIVYIFHIMINNHDKENCIYKMSVQIKNKGRIEVMQQKK